MADKPTCEESGQGAEKLKQEKPENNRMKETIHHGDKQSADHVASDMNTELRLSKVGLDAIINAEEIQSIMDDFYHLTHMTTAILDLEGNIIEATGWQDICTKFHRIHPDTAACCRESDLFIAKNLKPGEYVDYRCKNGLWDIVTPLYIGNRHLGNIYTGQFFYDDEQIDEAFFLKQAELYGFDKDSYLDALRRVPRYNRETIGHLMRFLVKFTTYISRISIANIQLEKEIHERKRAEEALKESETHLRTLIRTVPDLVWLKDQQGIYLFCNSRFETLFGAKEKDIIGKTDYDFVTEEVADFFRKHDLLAMAEGKSSRYEEELEFAADGHREIIETIKTPMYRPDGQLAGILGIGRDITERERIEKERFRMDEQYRQFQKVEAIGRLAGGVAHDLNNLLSPILGFGEILLDDFDTDDPRRKMVEQIVQASLRSRDLVRQLLAFSRKQTLEYKPVDMNKAVTGFEKLMRRAIREDIDIRIILSPDIYTVMADMGQIEQVIMNLAVNAADAMPEGGRLTIETKAAHLDEDYAAISRELRPGDYVMLAVSDTGCGMDEETRTHLFEPFFSTKSQGTGLGLATVYGIVKQHGGAILVNSEPGKGSTFKVYLPVSENVPIEEKTVEKPPYELKGSETILLVEDDKQVRDIAHAVLIRQGYEVLVAKNGGEALERLALHEGPVHLLLTDVIMPGMNGKELFARASEQQSGLKVLYMSGYTGDVIAHRGVLEKGIQFIQKPFSVQGLAARVREVLERD